MKYVCSKCVDTYYHDNNVELCSKCKSKTMVEKCEGFYKYREVCTNKKCNHKVYISIPINVYKEEQITYDPTIEYKQKLCSIHEA